MYTVQKHCTNIEFALPIGLPVEYVYFYGIGLFYENDDLTKPLVLLFAMNIL